MAAMPDDRPSRLSISRFVPLGVLILAAVLFVAFGGLRYRSLCALVEHGEWLREFVARG